MKFGPEAIAMAIGITFLGTGIITIAIYQWLHDYNLANRAEIDHKTPHRLDGRFFYVIPASYAMILFQDSLKLESHRESLEELTKVKNKYKRLCLTLAKSFKTSVHTGFMSEREKIWDYIDDPKPGDLVYEASSFTGVNIGLYLGSKQETVTNIKDFPASQTFDYHYIETIEGELQRWQNCEFKRIFETNPFVERDLDDLEGRKKRVEEAKARHDLVL